MNWSDYLAYLGVKAPDAFAGMLGGLVKALVLREKLWETITSTIIGAITANFLGGWIAGYLEILKFNREMAGFVTGVTAMVLVQLFINKVREKTGHD